MEAKEDRGGEWRRNTRDEVQEDRGGGGWKMEEEEDGGGEGWKRQRMEVEVEGG